MKTTLLFLFLFIALISQAQQPWRAKFFIDFIDSSNTIITDTVWIGSDSLADMGK